MTNGTDVHDTLHKGKEIETFIEPEMQSRPGLYVIPSVHVAHREILEPIMTQAFLAQPIIGNIIPTDEQRERIHMLAERILSNARRMVHLDDFGLDSFSRDVIMLAIVLVLRNWNDEDVGDSQTLWEYVCNQFALPFDSSSFANSPQYKMLREAITSCLSRHKRLRATTGKQYYTSLLIHALAPKAKFYDLFEQIFGFYAKNLHYHYLRNDPAFSAFAYAMKNRLEVAKTRLDDDIYIKSVQSSMAIKHYVYSCPMFMSSLVERIVRQMDSLVATGTIGKAEYDYIDTLLVGWHEKRSREERISDRKKRAEASAEKVITEFGNIRLSYIYEKGKVILVIPAIRLGEECDDKPQITIYRYADDTDPFTADLRYYGNYICITSSKMEIPIENLIHGKDNCRFDLRAIISYGGKNIFDSGVKLYREVIVFCNSGTEAIKRPLNEYVNIFAQQSCVVEGLETSPDSSIKLSEGGCIYRVLMAKSTQILVNGEPLYPVEQMISGLTLSLNISPVNYCKYSEGMHEYFIFIRQPMLEISSTTPNFEKQYRIVIGAEITSLSDYFDVSTNSYRIPLPKENGHHEFRIIDNFTHQRIYELPYAVFENFSLRFDGFYFTENYHDNGVLSVQNGDESTNFPYVMVADQNVMLVSFAEGDLAVDIPLFQAILDGEKLTEETGKVLWHSDIQAHALLEIEVPRGYTATVNIGSNTFMSSNVEIGNVIRAGHISDLEAVGVILRNENEQPVEIKLFDIAFEPYFQMPPLRIENGILLWLVERNFVGDSNTEFELQIQHKGVDCGKYKFGCIDELLELPNEMCDGVYHYTICAKKPGFFSKYEPLTTGHFIIGEHTQFWFDDCAIVVTEAILENDCLPLNQSSGIITKLRYAGEQYLNGETQHYPCYEGTLLYKHDGRLRPYATADYERNGKHHEQVNPVKVWVINEFTISLRTPVDDGLYVHKGWKSITDRKPPNKTMGLSADNWFNPDYYHYKVIAQSEV